MRYQEYSKLDSKVRIMVTTTSLSTGLNMSDIERIVQWDFPITNDIEDAAQRLERAGRKPSI